MAQEPAYEDAPLSGHPEYPTEMTRLLFRIMQINLPERVAKVLSWVCWDLFQ